MKGDYGDGLGCHDRDRMEGVYTEQYGAGSLLVLPAKKIISSHYTEEEMHYTVGAIRTVDAILLEMWGNAEYIY